MKKIIYVATGNKAKLADLQLFFSWIDPQISIELVPDYIPVEETGITLAENSKLKIIPYINKYEYPVVANDSGLFFDKNVAEVQDPLKVKRNALQGKLESDFTQAEVGLLMFEFYKSLAKKYGGYIDCQMKDVFSILLPDGSIKQKETFREYQLVDRDIKEFDIYHPLNSLRISKLTGKFMGEMSLAEEKVDKSVLVNALIELTKNYRFKA